MKPSSSSPSDVVSWVCAVFLVGMILVGSMYRVEDDGEGVTGGTRGGQLAFGQTRPCEEIYVVGEGETLNTISEKCGDPFIVERNPHIHDPDDVFPGLVIRITPSAP